MVEEEKLRTYNQKYEEVKDEIIEVSILKGNLLKQQNESKNKLKKLANDINDEKSSVWFDKAKVLYSKANNLKNRLIRDILSNLLGGTLLISLGYIVIELPLTIVVSVSSLITITQVISNIKRYNKDVKKCSVINIDRANLSSDEIVALSLERDKELDRNLDIRESLDIVNEKLEKLAGLKLDIENLIICLFSSLDNIIKNKSDIQNPFATWLNINYEDDEPKLEINNELKRTLNKKEEK